MWDIIALDLIRINQVFDFFSQIWRILQIFIRIKGDLSDKFDLTYYSWLYYNTPFL